MYVHRSARLIYLAHPRTASVATAELLQSVGFEHDSTISHHAPLDSTFTKERKSWHVFTTVRNHFDTCVSWALNGPDAETVSKRGLTVATLRRALDNGWVRGGLLWWLHARDADQVLRYETLQSELTKLLHKARLCDGLCDSNALAACAPMLRRCNVTALRKDAHYRRFYTQETMEYVAGRFEDELAEYGYSFERGHSYNTEWSRLF